VALARACTTRRSSSSSTSSPTPTASACRARTSPAIWRRVAELQAAADDPADEDAAAAPRGESRSPQRPAPRARRRRGRGDALDARLAGADLELVAGTVREALTNVRKHACASQTVVRVERLSRALRVTVEDDGVGADKRVMARASGLGLPAASSAAPASARRRSPSTPPPGRDAASP
jgi:hypothetical protein